MKKRIKHKTFLTIVAYLTINFFFSFLSAEAFLSSVAFLTTEASAKGVAKEEAKAGSQNKTKIHGEPFVPQDKQSRTIDSLETVLQTVNEDTIRIQTHLLIGDEYEYSEPQKALSYYEQALNIALNADSKELVAKCQNYIGIIYSRQGDYPKALEYYFKALVMTKEIGDKNRTAIWLGNIGNVYYNQGDYPRALEYYFKALRISEELGNKNGITRHLGNIGGVYHEQGDYPRALKYYFKSLKIKEELDNKYGIAVTLVNIGNVYYNQGDYPRALEYYFKALEMDEELGNKNHITACLGNIGLVYAGQGDLSTDDSVRQAGYSKALEYYFKALKMAKDIGDKNTAAILLGNIGSQYREEKKYHEAERYLLQALELDKEIGSLDGIRYDHKSLSELYAETGQAAYAAGEMAASAARYQKAYENHKEYSAAKDSLFNEEKSKDIGKLEAKYEFEMAEQDRKRIEEELVRIETEQKSRRDNLQYSGILIFLIVLIIAISFSGRLALPIRLAEGVVFFTFLLFFEFTLVLLDPYIENWTGGEPAYKLLINAGLAGMIFPLHQFFETMLKQRIFKAKRRKITKRQTIK